MNVRLAMQIMILEFPTDAGTLKRPRRSLAHQYHPDHREGDDTDFKRLSEAYAYIKEHAELFIESESSEYEIHMIDGTPLCELGLGLGPTTNGKPCDECAGLGHRPTLQPVRVPCGACENGWVDLHAAYPKAHGEGAKRCCFCCLGLGRRYESRPQGARMFCPTCRGTGEIKLYNTVIPKGALGALTSR